MKGSVRCAVSLFAVALASTAAQAQSGGAAPAAAEGDGLSTILVTAQHVEENVQRAPIAVDVVEPDELARQNVVRAEDLARTSPALQATNAGGSNTVFFLRGVGNFTVNAYSDPAVAFNYDGVYIGRPSSTSGFFYDLQRIEVLRGPQGTLYGRNATGGAINVIPARPELGVNSGDLTVGYGNYDWWSGQGALNLALGEKAALRVSGTYNKRDGYESDGTSDQDEWGARAQLYAELSDDFDVRLAGDYYHQGGAGTGAHYLGSYDFDFPSQSYVFTPSGFSSSQGLHDPRSEEYLSHRFVSQAGRVSEPLDSYPYNDNDYWGVTAEANWSTDAGTLTIQPAYREARLDNRFTNAGMRGASTLEKDQQFSIEARWTGKIGNTVDYLLGAYYFDEKNDGENVQFNQLTLTPFQNFISKTESLAAFGKLTVHVTDRLSLTAAGRYTDDKKDFDGDSDIYILFCGNPALPQDFCPTLPMMPLVNSPEELRAFYQQAGIPVVNVPLYALPPMAGGSQTAPFVLNSPISIDDTLKNDKFTYRLAAQYDVTDRNMIYASFETGYHSGGFSFARGLSSYQPETLDAYTIGTKNRFFDGRVQLNLEGFVWKYRNQQYSQFGFDLGTPPATVFLTRNIGGSTIKGFDVDLAAKLTPTTLISVNLQHLKTKYTDFVYFAPRQSPIPPNTACDYAATTDGSSNPIWSVDCSGFAAFNSPKWSFTINGRQEVELGFGQLVLEAGTRYRSSTWVQPDYQPWALAKSSWVSNASVTLALADERYAITAFVNNIEGDRRLSFVTANQGAGLVVGNSEPPRTYGVRVSAHF